MNWRWLALGSALGVLVLSCVLYSWGIRSSHMAFLRLLSGNKEVRIRSIEVQTGQNSLAFKEDKVTEYFTHAFRAAESSQSTRGASYDVFIELTTAGRVHCCLYVPRSGDRITVHYPLNGLEDDGQLYTIWLHEPIPDSVRELIARLMPGE